MAKSKGQALIEYGLIIGLVLVILLAALVSIKGDVGRLFTRAANDLDTAADQAIGPD